MKILDTNDNIIFTANNMADIYRKALDTLGTKLYHTKDDTKVSWTSILEAFDSNNNALTCIYDGKDYNNSLVILK